MTSQSLFANSGWSFVVSVDGSVIAEVKSTKFLLCLLRTFSHSLREFDYQSHKPGSLPSTSQHFGDEKPGTRSLETRWRQCRNKREC